MKIQQSIIQELILKLDTIIDAAQKLERDYAQKINLVHPDFRQSAENLIHYMAIREYNINEFREQLRHMGLTPFDRIEPHVMHNLLTTKIILRGLKGKMAAIPDHKSISIKKSRKVLNNNTRQLFGRKGEKRRTRIMVTMPLEVSEDWRMAGKFIKAGMNCARINCAHDTPEIWKKMIENLHHAADKSRKKIRIMMDLGGPKLRTGPMILGAKVVHIKPERDDLGNVSRPALLWLAPPDVLPPGEADALIPVDAHWLKKVKRGNVVTFQDSRNKKCSLEVIKKQGDGKWAICYDSTYITTGTYFTIHKANQESKAEVAVGELLPLEQYITLKVGDTLILHDNMNLPGEPAIYDDHGKVQTPAHVSCTMPEIFADAKAGEPILFDDGKIEGIIDEVMDNKLLVTITNAKDSGSRLKAEKGINLPLTRLSFSGLTRQDREDLKFVVDHADAVNVSFVNDADDVKQVLSEFEKLDKQVGMILKIETRKGFRNLPLILLEAMQIKPVGIMIARGDLAVEIGWNDMAQVQEEILRVCEAAHIPDIWATQVLENLAKKGIPSRAEITDAGMSQRAECVMLNKGPQITKAIKLLDKILRNMQEINKKKEGVLPKLKNAEKLLL